jgi:hypothetical protein
LSSPIVIHIYRPYASEEEYLANERFSIEAKAMLLIDQPPLPLDTAVVFDVTLENGQKPIRAEARVVGHLEPEGERPGGLRVRFRRFGAATKAFIDRAVNGTPAVAAPTLVWPAVDAPAPSVRVIEVEARSAPNAAPMPTPEPLQGNDPHGADEASGVHRKTARPVVAPANREALLARLRGRRVS